MDGTATPTTGSRGTVSITRRNSSLQNSIHEPSQLLEPPPADLLNLEIRSVATYLLGGICDNATDAVADSNGFVGWVVAIVTA
jgi:hypothetical protein